MAREFTYHHVRVRRSERLTPHLHRLVVGGEGLADWASTGVPDEALLLVLPDAAGRLVLPTDSGHWEQARWYTVRDVVGEGEHAEVVIDVVRHEIGLATRWAQQCEVGDELALTSTHGWYDRDERHDWQVLVGDVTGLPAIARIVAERGDVPTRVRVELADPADAAYLDDVVGAADLDVEWVVHDGTSRLADMTAAVDPLPGRGYWLVVGESAATRDARRHLRHRLGLPADDYTVVGYWRPRSEEWLRRYEAAQADIDRIYADGEAHGTDAEEIADLVDARMRAAGL